MNSVRPRSSRRCLIPFLVSLLVFFFCSLSFAADDDFEAAQSMLLNAGREEVAGAIERLGAIWDPRTLPLLEAVRDGTHPAASSLNNRTRRILARSIAIAELRSADAALRRKAAAQISEAPDSNDAKILREALEVETDPEARVALAFALAQIDVASSDPAERLAAVRVLRAQGGTRVSPLLEQVVMVAPAEDLAHQEAQQALRRIRFQQFFVTQLGNLFYGLSLASVLLLASLGLAITFGLMGVINMAHGEMLMIGAYTTYAVQNIFRAHFPAWFDFYLLFAVPAAFAVTVIVGMFLELTVIRRLYGRPLETLLATWGISLILIQTIRLLFGAQNVEVANPSWLSGGITLASGLILSYNRVATILFAAFVLLLVWLLFQRTTLGLQLRAVTQIRGMAAAMGVDTALVDLWTFGIGSGVAGLAGVSLSQLGNVGPELGQGHIVDCFMVVVLGGVGNIAGTVIGALGLGIVNKFLEPFSGAVLAKIVLLALVILFIQWRPRGLFALKGAYTDT